ncbi:MAG: PucR family transcriptional regulator, purine catabolism regulatory protein [Clostridia bacterium]|nr:PucR family transcriptional regulator, purine catabolism regulatory protein [Clostridia bacterium]
MAEGITVKEALDLIVLNGIKVGRVIAGFGGLDNIITSVSVIEVPDATRWYRGNELQITAFYSIKDDVKAQVRVIERIAQCNCSALVLCHTGIFLKEVSQELIDAANYYKLPLILVPAELAYIDIITQVLEAIIDKQKKKKLNTDFPHQDKSYLNLDEEDFLKKFRFKRIGFSFNQYPCHPTPLV